MQGHDIGMHRREMGKYQDLGNYKDDRDGGPTGVYWPAERERERERERDACSLEAQKQSAFTEFILYSH
jgi:hypothetical protein